MSLASTVARVNQTTGSWPVVKAANRATVTALVQRPHSAMSSMVNVNVDRVGEDVTAPSARIGSGGIPGHNASLATVILVDRRAYSATDRRANANVHLELVGRSATAAIGEQLERYRTACLAENASPTGIELLMN